jgi:Cytochrome oxidase complex assembly protein 1
VENNSGLGKSAAVPAELDYWNWGAFLLSWIWGIGNNTFIAFLMFVPLVNLVMLIVLGVKGNAWAWRNKQWRDIDHFKRVQRKWAIWGVGVWIVAIGFYAALSYLVVGTFMSSEAYKMGVNQLVGNSEAIRALGAPISAGFPWGTIKVSGPEGHASFQFSATGPNGDGTVYMNATKELGSWRIDRSELEVTGRAGRIDLGGRGPRIIRTVPIR